MTNRDLKQLSRADLLEMLIEQTSRVQELESQLDEANKILEQRDISIDEAGSIAEAALKLNGVFEAAQAAGAQYLENIRTLSERQEIVCAKREEESLRRAEEMLKQAKQESAALEQETKIRCAEMVARAEAESQAYWTQVSQRMKSFYTEYVGLKEMLQFMPKE